MDISSATLRPNGVTLPVGRLGTLPNQVTAVRTILAVAVGAWAVVSERPSLLMLAYAMYWAGDIADGWLARKLNQETRLGAVLDIVCDRACTAVLCVGLLSHMPEVAPVAVAFLLSFMVLDTMLSLAFLCWPVMSPNYFAQVDEVIYALNWSPPAKAVNTAGVVGAVLLGLPALAILVVAVVGATKVWSAHRVLHLLSQDDR